MSSRPESSPERPIVVGLGGSAGALGALQQFFDALPANPGAAFVVVLHRPSHQESSLDDILSARTRMPVQAVREPTELQADHVYVAPPGQALTLDGALLVPVNVERPEERRAPIDRFFRSLAQRGASAVGIVLSGAGSDGAVGLRAIEEAGGLGAVQDPSEAEHEGMPESAIQMGHVDLVLPAADLAERVCTYPETVERLQSVASPPEADEQQAEVLYDIFEQVRSHTGHNFSEYKESTMLRRLQRRMQVHQVASLEAYLDFLREHPEEVHALQKDFLISVTGFFRDRESFEALQETGVPALFEGKGAEEALRVWVVGTATGEEAYSLAMLLLEHARTRTVVPGEIQVFASDINEDALAVAREGRYPASIAADVPAPLLDRYFVKEGAQYVVKKRVREHLLFAPHNLLSDPPFSNLDLVSCRNLLIYLQRSLQDSVFEVFRYALNEGGLLFLGASESVDRADERFQVIDKGHRLYRLREQASAVPQLPSMPLTSTATSFRLPDDPDAPVPSESTAHQRLLADYAPPSVVVNDEYRLLHLSERAGTYLEYPSGTPRTNVVELVRPELQVQMRSVLTTVFAEGEPVRGRAITVDLNGRLEVVRLVAHPGAEAAQTQNLALVLFETVDEPSPEAGPSPEAASASPKAGGPDMPEEDADERRLRAELQQTREELRTTISEYESSQQELQAANEELRSMNEEYKSMTEELETSKEELQSVNEELKTVNQELEEKVEALREANSDLKNVMASTRIGTLFLDLDLCIQRYTPRIETLFNIRPDDRGRPIGDLTHHLTYDRLEADAEQVLADLQPVEREAQTDAGAWFLVRLHPYRTLDGDIDGVVIAFIDITDRREAEEALQAAHNRLRERTEQVQVLSDALAAAEANVRTRISQMLHDGLQQVLYTARSKANELQRGDASEEARALAAEIEALLGDGVEAARTLSRELTPPVGNESLRDALEWLAIHMRSAHGLSVNMHVEDTAGGSYDQAVRTLLFHTVRDLLFNVVAHAGVDEASLRLDEGEEQVRVVVEDEGTGFDPEALAVEADGTGLAGLRERMEGIGGTVTLDASPGEGTRVALAVPRHVRGTVPIGDENPDQDA
jgi:two-component system CheB/CheR fusion protein